MKLLYEENLSIKPVFTNNIVRTVKKYCPKEKIVVVAAEKILKFYPSLKNDFSNLGIVVIPFKDGEKIKNFKFQKELTNLLLKEGVDKDTTICAIGGGTLLDLCGFVASILLRGIKWFSIPTTLLSMADSSIGGKTAINTDFGKNLIGSYHFPQNIFVDINFLKTLPAYHLKNGLIECVKCGIIKDKNLFEKCIKADLKDLFSLRKIVERAQEIKIDIVTKDPFEKKGERYLLNFGHTVGHSLEKIFNYKVSHGRCVAKGIVYESALSNVHGFLKSEDFQIIKNAVSSISVHIKNIPDIDEIWENMTYDKKNRGKKVMYVPIREIGKPALKSPYLCEIDYNAFKKAFFLVE